jgi:hypothetical protein
MATYADRFRSMIAELEADPRIAVTRAYIAPPATDKAIERAHAALGFKLARDVLDFYRSANGVSLRWELAGKGKPKKSTTPFTNIDDTQAPGLVHLMPIEAVCEATYEEILWFDHMTETNDRVKVGGARVKLIDFAKGLRPFDYYSEFRMAAFYVGGRAPSPPFYSATITAQIGTRAAKVTSRRTSKASSRRVAPRWRARCSC